MVFSFVFFFFSSRRRHTRWTGDWSSDVCSSDLLAVLRGDEEVHLRAMLPLVLDLEHHGGGLTQDALRGPGEQSRVFRFVPFHGELIRSADNEAPLVERDGLSRFEPRAHDRVG